MAGVLLKDISQHLEGYRELMAKRAEVEARLKRAETEKPSVKEAIFERVTGEYAAEIERLEGELEPLRDQVDKMRKDIIGRRDEVDAQIKKTEEEIEELSFRCRVGEFDKSHLVDRERPLSERIDELTQQASQLKELLASIDIAESGESLADREEAEAETVDTAAASDAKASPETGTARPHDSEAKTKNDANPDTKSEPKSQAKSEPKSQAKSEPRSQAKSEPRSQAKSEPKSDAKSEPKSDAKSKPRPAPGSAPGDEENTKADGNSVEPAAKAAGSADKHVEAGDKPNGESTNPNGVVDTSNWAEELQRDMERTVHIRNRRATDAPTPSETTKATATGAPTPGETTKATAADAPAKAPVAPATKAKRKIVNDDGSPAGFPYLVITKGPGAGKKLPLIPVTMTVGREHDNNIELKDEEVSRYHARITFTNGDYRIEDLESSSGTWVNGERITDTVLDHGDKIKVGVTELLIDFEQ